MNKIFNNKGMTLVEIILSIGLVSIVMVQVLNILVNLKDEQVLGKDKTSDLTNRSIIMRTVQHDFNNGVINKISNCKSSAYPPSGYTALSCVQFHYSTPAPGGTNYRMLTATKGGKHYFIYGIFNAGTNSFSGYEAWELKSGKYPTSGCGYSFDYYGCNGGTCPNGISRFFKIYYPVTLSSINERTVMTFDLEFLHYYSNPTGEITMENITTCKIT